jgi:hypothetical protein
MKPIRKFIYSARVSGLFASTSLVEAQILSLIYSSNKTVECNSGWHFDPPTVVGACCTKLTHFSTNWVVSSIPCKTVWAGAW